MKTPEKNKSIPNGYIEIIRGQNGHHVFCNYDPSGDPKTCRMCKEFNKKYPQDNMTSDEMINKYFPGLIKIG